jgi:hypothetical protein
LTIVDRIPDAHDIAAVFDLVNDFISALQEKRDIEQILSTLRAARINTADDVAYWLNIVSDEIRRRDAAEEGIPEAMFALPACWKQRSRTYAEIGITEARSWLEALW